MQVQSIYAINFDKRLYICIVSFECAVNIFVVALFSLLLLFFCSFVNISISQYFEYLLLLHLECIQMRLQIVDSHGIYVEHGKSSNFKKNGISRSKKRKKNILPVVLWVAWGDRNWLCTTVNVCLCARIFIALCTLFVPETVIIN